MNNVPNLPEHMPPWVSVVSAPEFCVGRYEYFTAHHRVMIIGQETGANYNSLDGQDAENAFSTAYNGYVNFDFAMTGEGQQNQNSPFWQGFRKICDRLLPGCSNPYSAAWGNLAQVQRIEPPYSFTKLPRDVREILEGWQMPLLHARFRAFAPKTVICLTGHLRDAMLCHAVQDLELSPVGDNGFQLLASGFSKEFDAFFVRIDHPKTLRFDGRWHLIEEACDEASRYHREAGPAA